MKYGKNFFGKNSLQCSGKVTFSAVLILIKSYFQKSDKFSFGNFKSVIVK